MNIEQEIQKTKSEIENKDELIKTLSDLERTTKYQMLTAYKEKKELEKQLKILGAKLKNNTTAEKFIEKHPEFKYIGESNGKTKDYENIVASCYKCHENFRLFETNTGIGEVIIGVCPRCETEVNFTDYSRW